MWQSCRKRACRSAPAALWMVPPFIALCRERMAQWWSALSVSLRLTERAFPQAGTRSCSAKRFPDILRKLWTLDRKSVV